MLLSRMLLGILLFIGGADKSLFDWFNWIDCSSIFEFVFDVNSA